MGYTISGEQTTTVEKSAEKDSYIVTLTETWNQRVNDKEAKSVWKYKVTSDGKMELISSEENADIIGQIR